MFFHLMTILYSIMILYNALLIKMWWKYFRNHEGIFKLTLNLGDTCGILNWNWFDKHQVCYFLGTFNISQNDPLWCLLISWLIYNIYLVVFISCNQVFQALYVEVNILAKPKILLSCTSSPLVFYEGWAHALPIWFDQSYTGYVPWDS